MTISPTKQVVTTQNEVEPNSMIAMALQNNADPSVLSKLMDLQERWEATQARKEYMAAMAAFKKQAPAVLGKDKKVDFTSAKGRTHYNYAGLGGIVSQITVMLSDCGLNASWETKQDKDQVTVTCHITHSAGHRESTTLSGPMDDSGNKNRIQQIGSSVTYLQRYTLMAALGLATKDQDDDGGQREPVKMPQKKQETPQEPPSQPQDTEFLTGELVDVQVKTGEKNGKAWARYGIKIGDEIVGTFSDTLGQQAQDLKGRTVCAEYKTEGKYKTLVRLAIQE